MLNSVDAGILANAYRAIVPEAVLVGAACVLFLMAAFRAGRGALFLAAVAGVAAAAGVAFAATHESGRATLGWQEADLLAAPEALSVLPFDPSGVAAFTRWFVLGVALLLVGLAWADAARETAGEYLACLLVLAAGASLVGRANDLISLFLALELVSVPTYVLLALPARNRSQQEAAVKYFLLSVLSSAVMLFGFSYLYGLTGSTNLHAVLETFRADNQVSVNPVGAVAVVLAVAGLAFRLTAVPFHFYAPDVYEGASAGVVAQLAVVPKIAGFVALVRVLGMVAPATLPFDAGTTLIPLLIWVVAAVSMTLGNMLALLQNNLKRLMAYSGIAHTGYMLMTVVTTSNGVAEVGGLDALLVYLVAYALMTLGFFAVLLHLGQEQAETVDDLAGLGSTHPLSAAVMSVSVASLIGLPLTAGLAGKFLVFYGALNLPAAAPMQTSSRILVGIAAVNAALGAVYYLRLLKAMYLRGPLREVAPSSGPSWPRAVGVVCAVTTVVFGAYPDPLRELARQALVARPTPANPGQ